MGKPDRIDPAQACLSLAGWRPAGGRPAIVRKLRFPGFAAAFAFMTEVAAAAEAMDHHPEWTNVYDRVEVTLTTHSAGGVTELDIRLAAIIDAAAARAGAS